MIEFEIDENSLRKLVEQQLNSDQIKQAMGKVCALVERTAKEKAPKDTGALRRSITSNVKEEADYIVGTIYTPLEYAPYVEYGTGLFAENGNGRSDVPWSYKDDEGNWHSTSGQHPHPYMRPALTDNKEKILQIFEEAFE